MNLLNRPDASCDETANHITLDDCIKNAIEKKLNCTLPDMSSGEALAPVGKPINKLCSSKEEFLNYTLLRELSSISELKIFQDYGCRISCQDNIMSLIIEMNFYVKANHIIE